MIPGVTTKPDKPPPLRVILYGPPGVGKSTWAAGAPAPLFLSFEDGLGFIDVPRVNLQYWSEECIDRAKPKGERPPSYQSTMRALLTTEHPYQTIVIDTLDWAYACLGTMVSRTKLGGKHIDEPEYGAGHRKAMPQWRGEFMAQLDRLHSAGLNVIMLAHSGNRKEANAHGDDYLVEDLKLTPKISALCREWADAVLFATCITSVVEGDRVAKASGGNIRQIQATAGAAHVAKNRYGITKPLPLTYAAFEKAIKQ